MKVRALFVAIIFSLVAALSGCAGSKTYLVAVGYLALFVLFKLLRKGVFHLFAPYCIALGLVVILQM